MREGEGEWRFWRLQIGVNALICIGCWTPELALNVSPLWFAREWAAASVMTIIWLVLVLMPMALKHVSLPMQIIGVGFVAWLFYMCFYGSSESVVRTRARLAAEASAAFTAGTIVADNVQALRDQLVDVRTKLKDQKNPPFVSDEALKNLREARDNAKSNECGLTNRSNSNCATKIQATKTAQDKLEAAQTLHDLQVAEKDLPGRINRAVADQHDAPPVSVDTAKAATKGMAAYINSRLPSFVPEVQAETLEKQRPYDISFTTGLVSFLGPIFLMSLNNGFFSFLRLVLPGRRKEDVQPDVVEDSSLVEQTPTPGVAVQPSPQIGTPTPHVVELAPQNEEPPPLAVKQTSTPMKRTPTPDRPKRKDYVEGVMEWMKGVTQTPEGERYTPSGLHLPYAKFCEREGFPIAAPDIFGSIVRNEGGLTTTKIKGQDYFRVAIRGANTTRLKVVKA